MKLGVRAPSIHGTAYRDGFCIVARDAKRTNSRLAKIKIRAALRHTVLLHYYLFTPKNPGQAVDFSEK